MNARLKINMVEVTRLTRDGQLSEAMAILRGSHPPFAIVKFGGRQATRV